MSCSDAPVDGNDADTTIERRVELPVEPGIVWNELPALLGDDVELVAEPGGPLRANGPDGEWVGVVDDAVPAERLAFRWVPTGDPDAPPSEVEITLEPSSVGTILHVRETRLDGAHLARSAFLARASSAFFALARA